MHAKSYQENADDLRQKLRNYRLTRRTAAPSLCRWLDALIEDAESRLAALTADSSAATATATDDANPDDAPARKTGRHRNSYPLDEDAPWQRPHG